MTAVSDESIVERIYEAAVIPEMWPAVLDLISLRLEAFGGLLLHGSADGLRWTSTENNRDLAEAVTSGGMLDNEWLRRYVAGGHLGFAEDRAVFGEEDPNNSEMYRQLLHPRGLAYACGTVLAVPTGETIVVGFERETGRSPFEEKMVRELDLLRPHIARAAVVAGRLQLTAAATAVATMRAIGLPAAVVDRRARVRFGNDILDRVPGTIRIGAHDRLSLADRAADRLFAEALTGPTGGGVRSIPLRATDESPASVVHVVPVSRAGQDIFSVSQAIVVVTPATGRAAFDLQLLRGCFDLTVAEARVAAAIAAGKSLEQHAADHGISRETARTHLKRTLAKTGTARQHELAAMLAPIGAMAM